MTKQGLAVLCMATALLVGFGSGDAGAGEPAGAKALFFSGEGTTMASSATAPQRRQTVARATTPSNVKYMGISYWIDRLGKDGTMRRVGSKTVFRQGDRIKVSLKSNREGYLYVINLGSTGSSTVLFPNARTPQGDNRIYPDQTYEIPPTGFFRFDENPGEETLLVMLSPTPMDGGAPQFSPPDRMTASAPLPPSPPAEGLMTQPTAQAPQAAPFPDNTASLQEPPPEGMQMQGMQQGMQQDMQGMQMMANAGDMGSKGLPRGAKDLMIEELTTTASTRAVSRKDLFIEEDSGPNPASYAVAPVSTLQQGGRLISLKISLKHR